MTISDTSRAPLTANVTRLGRSAIDECRDLAESRHWDREERKWDLLFAVGEVYGIRDQDGELATAAVLARNGATTATIGMVLTAERYERRGLGAATVRHLVSVADSAVLTMYATENGRPLYERLGFVADGVNTSYRGTVTAETSTGRSRPAEPADLPGIRAVDAHAHGADRSKVLNRLPRFCSHLRVLDDHGAVTGYAGAWPNDTTTVVGPVIAANEDDALALVTDLVADIDGPIRLEAHSTRPRLTEWARSRDLSGFDTTTMTYRGEDHPGARDHWWSPITVALG
ncbi:GNAT family N-acetyltransferase [Stackebrandtia soli]|uniref:GNAT family N-acetyltransferase n=1 Tax=Stackebrandtia soli TaxID=1892856 RepID=UPI0039EBC480